MNEDFKSQEHNQENALRITVSYNLKKVLAGIMLAAVPVFVACEKDTVKPDNNGGTGGNTQPKHNVELIYDRALSSLPIDTVAAYAMQSDVDTVFMIPEQTNQYVTLSANQLSPYMRALRKRHNVNPNKVFGKGDMKLNSLVLDHPEIVRFFADTLKYNVRTP